MSAGRNMPNVVRIPLITALDMKAEKQTIQDHRLSCEWGVEPQQAFKQKHISLVTIHE